jgi:predicted  nucleic acid-binding Zn-ribbon protein
MSTLKTRSTLAAELQAAYERIEELEDAIREAADLVTDEDDEIESGEADEGDD